MALVQHTHRFAWTRPSIVRRLLVALLISTALLCAGVYAALVVRMQAPVVGSLDGELRTLAEAVHRMLASPSAPAALEATIAGASQLLIEADDIRSFRIWRSDGRLLAASSLAPKVDVPPGGEAGFYDIDTAAGTYRVYASWSRDRTYRVEVMQSQAQRQTALECMAGFQATTIGPVLAIGTPIFLFLTWLAVRAGLRPLLSLSDELASRAPDDLRPLRVPRLHVELEPVVQGLNTALSRLNGLLQREREFLVDAAHELRTPLSVVTTQAELVVQASDERERAEAARCLRAGARRTGRLVSQLLALARLESNAVEPVQPVNVADLVRDCLATFDSEARLRGIELSYEGPDELRVESPAGTLETVVNNLVGNAIRYGNAGGTVEVLVQVQSSREVLLSVRDDGPGIPTSDRERVFGRFQRGANPRANGSGLGLAIVAAAAKRMGASVTLGVGLRSRGVDISLRWRPAAMAT
jgi:two-component system sensor histidine kinase QseC